MCKSCHKFVVVSCAGTVSVLASKNAISDNCLPPETEENEATSLAAQAYGSNKLEYGKDIGLPLGRIKVQDLKLQTVKDKPIILGEGGSGKVMHL